MRIVERASKMIKAMTMCNCGFMDICEMMVTCDAHYVT
jgi:hypothetical protein